MRLAALQLHEGAGRIILDAIYDRKEAAGNQTHIARATARAVADQSTVIEFRFIHFTLIPKIKK